MATVFITGANRGIGLELCRQFQSRGDRVIAACRSASDDLQALGVDIQDNVDVASDDSIANLAHRLGDLNIDILVNNAGIASVESLEDLDIERMRKQFEVNSLGPLRITHALLPRLSAGSKIAMVTSRMGSIADNTSGGGYGYRMSKAALNIASVSLAKDLAHRGIAIAILHPGWVQTDMTRGRGSLHASESVEGLIARIDGLSLDTSGTFWHTDGSVLPW